MSQPGRLLHDDADPQHLLESFPESLRFFRRCLAGTSQATKVRQLANVAHVLAELHAESCRDFRLSVVGARTERRGGPSRKTLSNTNGADYAALIKIFQEEVGGSAPRGKSTPRANAYDVVLLSIRDPHARATVRSLLVERDKLRRECDLLKHHIQSSQSPSPLGRAFAGPSAATVQPSPLSDHSRGDVKLVDRKMLRALADMVTPDELAARGLSVREDDAIFISDEEVFRPAFLRVVRDITS